jgi:hypothetical protein
MRDFETGFNSFQPAKLLNSYDALRNPGAVVPLEFGPPRVVHLQISAKRPFCSPRYLKLLPIDRHYVASSTSNTLGGDIGRL